MWFISPASSVRSPQKAEECKAGQRWHHAALNGKEPRSVLSLGFVLIAFRMHTHDALLKSKVCVCVYVLSVIHATLFEGHLSCSIYKAHAFACLHTQTSYLVDGYCTTDQSDRVGDGPCHMIEREAFQVITHSWYGNKAVCAISGKKIAVFSCLVLRLNMNILQTFL